MMKVKSILQKIFGTFLGKPIILKGKTLGYSLVRSQQYELNLGDNIIIVPPFSLKSVDIGSYTYLAKNNDITNAQIGKFCSIGPNFCCGLGIHPTNGISTSPMFYSTAKQNGITLTQNNKIKESEKTIIGNDVFIGANVTVLDGVKIGDGAIIGAGAVVSKNIPPYAIAVGVPARVVKYRFDNDTIDKILSVKWWDWNIDKLKYVEEYFFDVENFLKTENDKTFNNNH